MDLRVLIAVFLTLLAVAVGMAQGDLTSDDVLDAVRGFNNPEGITDILTDESRPTANKTVDAAFLSDSRAAVDITLPTRVLLTVSPGTPITVADATLTAVSNETIVLHQFTGTVTFHDGNVTLDGDVFRLDTGRLSFNYSQPKRVTVGEEQVSRITFQDLAGQSLAFDEATGVVNASNTRIMLDEEPAIFQGFNGNLTVTETHFELKGAVHRARIGSVTID